MKFDFLENEATNEKGLFYIFDLFFIYSLNTKTTCISSIFS